MGRRLKLPVVGALVEVHNPVTGVWMTGNCTGHLSTQWMFNRGTTLKTNSVVIHPDWKWRYL